MSIDSSITQTEMLTVRPSLAGSEVGQDPFLHLLNESGRLPFQKLRRRIMKLMRGDVDRGDADGAA